MLSSLELIYSSLQTSFLAFAVYLAAIILKTLLQGRSLFWFHWLHRKDCIDGEGDDCIDYEGDDCIDGGGDDCSDDTVVKIVTIVLQVPRILPSDPMSIDSLVDSLMSDEDIVTNILFTSSKLTSLNNKAQECVNVCAIIDDSNALLMIAIIISCMRAIKLIMAGCLAPVFNIHFSAFFHDFCRLL